MKKLLLLGLLAGAMSFGAAAEEVTVLGSDFTVSSSKLTGAPEGWNLLKVGSGGSWTLYSSSGELENTASSTTYGNDYIITPKAMGQLKIKWCAYDDDPYGGWGDDGWGGYSSSGSMQVYKMQYNEETQAWEKAETQYIASKSTYNTYGYDDVEIDLGYDGGYYGIIITTAAIKQITYTPYDENVEVRSLKMENFSLGTDAPQTISQSEAGAPIPYSVKVKLTNNGTVALNPGDEGYSVSMLASTSSSSLATSGVLDTLTPTESLAVGETKEFEFSGTYSIDDITAAGISKDQSYGYYRFALDAKENISDTFKYAAWMQVYPYEMFYKLTSGGENLATIGLNFGLVSEDGSTNGTKRVAIENKGAMPLTVTGVELPEGFICEQDFTDFVVSPVTADSSERTKYLDIKVDPAASGILTGQGKFIISDDENPVVFTLNAKKVAPGMWLEQFNGNNPSGWILKGATIEYCSYSYTVSGSSSNVLSGGTRYDLENEDQAPYAISPKLSAAEGEIMAFEARTQGPRFADAWINIYSSPDRQNWTSVARIRKYDIEDAELNFSDDSKMHEYTIPMTAGDNYYKFVLSYAQIDNLMGGSRVTLDHDVVLTETQFPARGMVNNLYTGSVKLLNVNTANEEEGTYVVTLLEDGETVATITETPVLIPNSETTIPVSYTPHVAGTHNLSVSVALGDVTLASEPVEVNVAEESVNNMATVGEGTLMAGSSSNPYAPACFFNKKNVAHQLYTAEQLAAAGINPGTVITGLSYTGYCKETSKKPKGAVKYWISSTDQETLSSTDEIPTGDDNLVATISNFELVKIGTESEPVEFITINFDEPYTYTGGNIIISDYFDLSDYTSNTYFTVDNTITNQSILRSDDCRQGQDIFTVTPKTIKGFTQTNFYYVAEPTYIQGVITEAPAQARAAGDAIEGALVTLTSGEVIYSGTTDAEGHYQIPVVQTDKEYNVKVTKDGYYDYEEAAPVSFADGNVDLNIQLTKDTSTGIGSVEAASVNVSIRGNVITVEGVEDAQLAIFSLNGMEVARAQGNTVSTANLAKGVYVLRVESEQGSASVRFVKR